MENLLKRQNELGDLAALKDQKILSGKIRKAFCLEYIQHIQTEMTEFNANHAKIMVKQSQETEEYIAKKYYEHLALAESNYEAAWKILQERYDNLRLQFTTQVRLVLMGLN
ncbi:unnamed protein product [Ceratitis capitata]|uniref:(Mediterranean fruit fly) hypothetical protein n=1 Tax=Ceratitis capitata TaxID=7213 RepID=A0A811UXP8_CERCA|nr:unnamed protein product [Ceratitis capitata]